MKNTTGNDCQTNVCHLVYSFGFGGLEQVIANLINNSNDPEINHTIISLTDDLSFYYKVKNKTKIHCLYKQPGNDIRSHMRLFHMLRTLNIDVLNTYNFGTLEYQLTALFAGVKKRIHSAHGYGGDDSGGKSKKRNIITKVVSLALHKYITVSPDLKLWALNTIKIDKKKVDLIYNGINTSVFKPRPKTSNKGVYTICSVGRADPIKNQALLLRAYSSALHACPEMKDSKLVIVGDGPSFSGLTQLVLELNIKERVELLGYQDDIPAIMQNSDIFVLSSLYEAMPMTILEAMACELPVIATNVGGTPYLLSEKEGWLVDSDNESALSAVLVSAYLNKEDRQHKGENGTRLVSEKYTVEAMCTKFNDLYKKSV